MGDKIIRGKLKYLDSKCSKVLKRAVLSGFQLEEVIKRGVGSSGFQFKEFRMSDVLRVQFIHRECRSQLKHLYVDTETPLIAAARLGLNNMLKVFVIYAYQFDKGLDAHSGASFREYLKHTNSRGSTALHEAAAVGNLEGFMLLVKESLGLLRSVEDKNGKTPLEVLCKGKYDKTIFEVLTLESAAKGDPPPAVITIDNQHQQVKYTESTMEPHSYKTSDTQSILNKLNEGKLEMSPNKNNILHIAAKVGKGQLVTDILNLHPSLLSKRNSEGETPAYVAAKEGHFDIIELIINHLNSHKYQNHDVEEKIEEVMTRNSDNDTALHVAIRNDHAGVVFWLTTRVSILTNHVNNFEESPLYLVAERGYYVLMEQILKNCHERNFKGPNGKTALHAAALSNSAECIDHIPTDLLNAQDLNGRTALYYAVVFGHASAVQALARKDESVGYCVVIEDNINSTAIHIAASWGHCDTLKVLIKECPGCPEITNSKGRNILHVAIENKKDEVIELILQHERLTSLINQQDIDGNTPLHLLAASDVKMGTLINDPRINFNILNKDKRTPFDIASTADKRMQLLTAMVVKKEEESFFEKKDKGVDDSNPETKDDDAKGEVDWFKMTVNVILVATLIATATFAAAFAVPGGFDGNKGTPLLLNKPSFQVFAVTNALAFTCSCSAIISYVILLVSRYKFRIHDAKGGFGVITRVEVIYSLTGIAMVAMVIAFFTGVYAVLHKCIALAICVCTICTLVLVSALVFPKQTASFTIKLLISFAILISLLGFLV